MLLFFQLFRVLLMAHWYMIGQVHHLLLSYPWSAQAVRYELINRATSKLFYSSFFSKRLQVFFFYSITMCKLYSVFHKFGFFLLFCFLLLLLLSLLLFFFFPTVLNDVTCFLNSLRINVISSTKTFMNLIVVPVFVFFFPLSRMSILSSGLWRVGRFCEF